MRRTLFLFLVLLCSLPCFAEVAPSTLSGQWFQKGSDKTGTLTMTILGGENDRVTGTIFIAGTTYCEDPVNFAGTVSSKNLTLRNSDETACGHRGNLLMNVVIQEEGDGKIVYQGNFVYKFLGIAWVSGTFTLRPISSDKQ